MSDRQVSWEIARRKVLQAIEPVMAFGHTIASGVELLRGGEHPIEIGILAVAWFTLWGWNTNRLIELGADSQNSESRRDKARENIKSYPREKDTLGEIRGGRADKHEGPRDRHGGD